jgi:uncharacterized protein YfaS (alpha-2-macroglobulin family)
VVVDESVLALAGYQLTSPLSLFYPARANGQTSKGNREQLLLFNVEDLKNLQEATLLIPNL